MATNTVVEVEQEELEYALTNLLDLIDELLDERGKGWKSQCDLAVEATRAIATTIRGDHPYAQTIWDMVTTLGDDPSADKRRELKKLSHDFLMYIATK